jgi:hypothetical protein
VGTFPDAMAVALADCEAIVRAHQPDAYGFCRACPDEGGRVHYPCRPLLFNEDAADRLRRRIQRLESRRA